jgi:hypothetical protein
MSKEPRLTTKEKIKVGRAGNADNKKYKLTS